MCNAHIEYDLIIRQRSKKRNEVKRPLLIFYTFQYLFFSLGKCITKNALYYV